MDAAGEVSARFAQGAGMGCGAHSAQMLTARAESVGVRLAWGTRVEAVRQGEAVAGGRTICSRYVVCADGQNSSLRPMVGLGAGKVYRRRYGFRNHYAVRPWSRYVEVHWADCGQLYVTPVGAEDLHCLHQRPAASAGGGAGVVSGGEGAVGRREAERGADGRSDGDA